MKQETTLGRHAIPRPVWILALSQGFQSLGSGIFAVSLALFAGNTGDFQGLGFVLAAKTLPTVVVALIGGVAADRWQKKSVAAASLIGTALITAFIAISVPEHGLNALVQVLALVMGLISAFGAASNYSLLPSLVAAEVNFRSNALVRTFRNVGFVLAPGIAGLIVSTWTPMPGILLSGALIGIAAVLILALPIREKAVVAKDTYGEIKEAASFARSTPWLIGMLVFWSIFLPVESGASSVLQPIYVTQNVGVGGWSLIATSLTVGYICGSIVAIKWEIKKNLIRASVFFISFSSVQILTLSLSQNVVIWVIASFFAGVGLEISGVAWGSALQTRIKPENLGKISSLDYSVSFGMIPVGYALYGVLGEHFDSQVLMLTSGSFLLFLALLGLLVVKIGKFDSVGRLTRF